MVKRTIWRRFVVAVAVVAGLVLVPSSAASDPQLNFCPEYLAPEPEVAGWGVASIITPPLRFSDEDSWNSGGRYQQNGIAGTQWHTIVTKNCFDGNRASARGMMADTIWDWSRVGSDIVIFIYQLALSDVATEWLGSLVGALVAGLREGFWRPLLGSVVIISALWLAWVGLIRKRATLTFEGTIWMIVAVTLGIWVMSAPNSIMGLANNITGAGVVLVHDSLSRTPLASSGNCPPPGVTVEFQGTRDPEHFSGGGTPRPDAGTGAEIEPGLGPGMGGSDGPIRDPAENDGAGPADSGENDIPSFNSPDEDEDGGPAADLAMTPVSHTVADNSTMAEFSSDAAVWKNSEMIFSALVCQPAMIALFGSGGESSEAATSFMRQTLESQSVTHAERQQWGQGATFDPDVYEDVMEQKESDYRAVSEQIYHYYPESWPSWSGQAAGDRLGTAIVAFLGMILAGSFIVIVAIAILMIKMGMMLMIIAAPIFFLIGVHPGFGRIVLGRYAEMFVGMMIMQVVLSLVMVVYLIMYGFVFRLPFPWAIKVAIMAILMLTVLHYRKKVLEKIAAASSGSWGRIMQKVSDDKTLSRAAMTNPAVALRKADRAAANKLKPIVASVLGGGVGAAVGGALASKTGARSPDQAPSLGRTTPTAAPTRSPGAAPPIPPTTPPGPPGGGGGGPTAPGGGGGGPTAPGGGGGGPRPHGGTTAPRPLPGPSTPPPGGGGGEGTPPPGPGPSTPPPTGGGGGGPTAPGPSTPPPTGGGGRTGPTRTGGTSYTSPLSGRRVVIHRDGAPPLEVPRHEVIDEVVEERHTPPPPPPSSRTVRRRRVIRWDRPLSGWRGRGGATPPRRGDPPPRT